MVDRWVRGTVDLSLASLLKPFGIALDEITKEVKPSLGIRTSREGNDCKLANVYEGGAAHRSGLSGGDLLVAVDGLRVSATNLDNLLARYRVGDVVTVYAFRRDELLQFQLCLIADETPQMELSTEMKPVTAVRSRNAWLTK